MGNKVSLALYFSSPLVANNGEQIPISENSGEHGSTSVAQAFLVPRLGRCRISTTDEIDSIHERIFFSIDSDNIIDVVFFTAFFFNLAVKLRIRTD